MKILQLLNKYASLAEAEPQTAATSSRREMFRRFGAATKEAATIALPLGAALLSPKKVRAQAGTSVVEVLNFALTLEYLEAEFYNMGLDASGLLSGRTRSVIQQISKHEDAHVTFLRSAIQSQNGTPVEKPEFDFTAGGTFGNVFTDEQTFLALAQAFEDTGVRAYKGQAGNLLGNDDLLLAALRIHSVEARHAAEIRRLRGSEAWIEMAENTTGVSAADAVYAGEAQTTQLGVNLESVSEIDNEGITESFDEPLSRQQVLDIAALFIT